MLSDPVISLLIFCFVVFIYIHMSAEWKKSEDLEVYESPLTTPSHLSEICDVKQPVLFQTDRIATFLAKMSQTEKHDATDVLVKDMREYRIEGGPSPEPVVLPLHSAKRLTESDTDAKYLAEQNDAFLEETNLASACASLDWALKPHACVSSKYDYIFGSAGVYTPYRYHTHSRMFIVPITGRVRVRLAPWKMHKYLWPTKDYETFEFRSSVDPYDAPSTVKCINVDVAPGQLLFVPQHWWYSMKLSKDTTASTFVYNTAINALANSWDWIQYFLQQNNITQRIVAPLKEPQPNEIPALDSVKHSESPSNETVIPGENVSDEPKQIVSNAGIYVV